MDIHKPKPWHGLREFLKEYLIIFVGVLTALAAEQMVEAAHHRAEAAEARRSLGEELGADMNALEDYVRQSPCALARLDELAAWQRSWADGKPTRLGSTAISPTYVSLRTNVWRVATAAGVAQMPFEERIGYGSLYDTVVNEELIREDARHRWEAVAQASAAKALTPEEVNRLGGDLAQLWQDYRLFNGNYAQFRANALRLGVRPPPIDESDLREHLEAVCRPLRPQH